MATVPTPGHPVGLPPWRMDPSPGYGEPVAMTASSWRGVPVAPLHLPIACTPHYVGLARGESAPYYGEEAFIVSRPRGTDAGHPVRIPPRVVYIPNMTEENAAGIKAALGERLTAAGVWCYGGVGSGINADQFGFLEIMPFHATGVTETSHEFELRNAGDEVFSSGADVRTWRFVEIDPPRFAGREALVVLIGQFNTYSQNTHSGQGLYKPDPFDPDTWVGNYAWDREDYPGVIAKDNAALHAARAVFGRMAYRVIGRFNITTAPPPRPDAAADYDAFCADAWARDRDNIDAAFAGIDYQSHYFNVAFDDPATADDLIDVVATVTAWITEFYPEV